MRSVLRALAAAVLVAGAFAPAATAARAARAAETVDTAAVAAWRAGERESARAAWLALLEREDLQGAERGRILHNLGNAAWRAGAKLEAVGWYSASLRLRPRAADTWTNLEHARREAGLEPADRGDLAATLERVLTAFDPAEARLLALAGLAAWGAALALEALRGGRLARWLCLAALALALACSAPWLRHALSGERDPQLVVAEGRAELRSEPRADATVVAHAPAGTVVERTDELAGWTRVRTADGRDGWAASKALFALRR
jgi:hypothetical protein